MDHQAQQDQDPQEQPQVVEAVELSQEELEQVVGGALYTGTWD